MSWLSKANLLSLGLTRKLIIDFYPISNLISKLIYNSSYHATAPADEALKLTRQKIPSAAALQLKSLSFDDFGLQNDETLQVKCN